MDYGVKNDAQVAVRIGDAEREHCLEMLAEHHALGRVPVEELDRRQRLALVAETRADLAALLVDLPRDSAPATKVVHLGRMTSGWSLPSSRTAKWVAAPLSIAVGGYMVEAANAAAENDGFFFGVLAASAGFLGHVVITKWPKGR